MEDPQPRPLWARRLRPGELVALDGLAALVYTLLLLGAALIPEPAVPAWLAVPVVVMIGLPIAARRWWPWPVFGVVFAATTAAMLLGVVTEPFLAAAFVLYAAALRSPRRRREPTTLIAQLSLAGVVVLLLAGPVTVGVGEPTGVAPAPGMIAGQLLIGGVFIGGAWTLGRAVRQRRVYAARYAEQLAAQAATEERLRIARELHDVVSHTLSLVGVKAGIANHVADTRPEEVRDALRVIERTSREALAEMHQMLGLLRAGAQPGLADLPALAQRAAAAGVPVALEVRGTEQLPASLAWSVSRIVQEAVTNVIKHAGPANCRVTVEGTGAGVRVEVVDDGRGDADGHADGEPGGGSGRGWEAPGHGLTGMRERAARHGGTLHAGPRPGGGYAVSAWLPLAPAVTADPEPSAGPL